VARMLLHLDCRRSCALWCALLLAALVCSGCYVPGPKQNMVLNGHSVCAVDLPQDFRTPSRGVASKLNLASLSVPPPAEYLLGPEDTLEVTVPGLSDDSVFRPIRTRLMSDGRASLPLIGNILLAGMNLRQAEQAINQAYANGFLQNPSVIVILAEKATINVTVLGEVNQPGVYELPKYENDVAHALAQAGGMTEFAAEVVELHRRRGGAHGNVPLSKLSPGYRPASIRPVDYVGLNPANAYTSRPMIRRLPATDVYAGGMPAYNSPTHHAAGAVRQAMVEPLPPAVNRRPVADSNFLMQQHLRLCDQTRMSVLSIPLRGESPSSSAGGHTTVHEGLSTHDVQLSDGDVLQVPRQQDEVFFVVGPLSRTNVVNFSVRDRDRQLGNAFLLPIDRDIDVVTAVAMAGYIDPIESPSTVTVQRNRPDGPPMLVQVDLIRARYNWNENLYVQPGDIIYLNPEAKWYFRRTLDRVIPTLITAPYAEAMGRWINPRNNGN